MAVRRAGGGRDRCRVAAQFEARAGERYQARFTRTDTGACGLEIRGEDGVRANAVRVNVDKARCYQLPLGVDFSFGRFGDGANGCDDTVFDSHIGGYWIGTRAIEDGSVADNQIVGVGHQFRTLGLTRTYNYR